MKKKRIAVLMGGLSAEREVSLMSGAAVHGALVARGYDAVAVDMGRDLAQQLINKSVDVAFICLHGRYGEDGAVQGLLEVMGIPYTGSGVLASALAMNKIFAKKVFQACGLTVAPYRVVRRGEEPGLETLGFSLPVVVKPSQEGSSVGISIVRREEDFRQALDVAFTYDEEILVEQFIKGREIRWVYWKNGPWGPSRSCRRGNSTISRRSIPPGWPSTSSPPRCRRSSTGRC